MLKSTFPYSLGVVLAYAGGIGALGVISHCFHGYMGVGTTKKTPDTVNATSTGGYQLPAIGGQIKIHIIGPRPPSPLAETVYDGKQTSRWVTHKRMLFEGTRTQIVSSSLQEKVSPKDYKVFTSLGEVHMVDITGPIKKGGDVIVEIQYKKSGHQAEKSVMRVTDIVTTQGSQEVTLR